MLAALPFSGGATNPVHILFLLQIVIGAVILEPRWSLDWSRVNACLCMLLLTFAHVPLNCPPATAAEPFDLYLLGQPVLLCRWSAVLLVVFVVRLDRNRRESDRRWRRCASRPAEEDHIIRMGLLASGAAHELGTPLSSLSVILGDWGRICPRLRPTPISARDLADMQRELQRCKTIVSGILMSAGELRGEDPQVDQRAHVPRRIVAEWQIAHARRVALRETGFGEDAADRGSDPGAQQVIGNVIDNAVEVSPESVHVSPSARG